MPQMLISAFSSVISARAAEKCLCDVMDKWSYCVQYLHRNIM